jgi:hypothetical protein
LSTALWAGRPTIEARTEPSDCVSTKTVRLGS